MNRKLFGLLVPVMGFAVLVGSGFASWHFYESVSPVSADATGSGNVVGIETEDIGTIAGDLSFGFVLDQTEGTKTAAEFWDDANVGCYVNDEVAPTFELNQDYFDSLKLANVATVTFSYSYEIIAGDLEAYVELVNYQHELTLTLGNSKPAASDLEGFELDYISGQKPTTKALWDAMDALGDTLTVKLTISYKSSTTA